MGAEIGLLSITQIQKLSQSKHHHPNQLLQHQPHPPSNPSSPSSWIMWNPREPQEDDDSWEVRAFAQDTTSIMGTTWPPRSYTCTFCRREFRSAQALGGHMNVHRRDRARLHHQQPPPASLVNSNLISPQQELVANNSGLCFLYHLPSPDGIGNFSRTSTCATSTLASTLNNACGESVSASTLLSIMPYPPNNLVPTSSPSFDFQLEQPGFINSSYCNSSRAEETTSYAGNEHEELDLELRLGHRPTPI